MKRKLFAVILCISATILLLKNYNKYKPHTVAQSATYWPNIIIGISVFCILVSISIFYLNRESILYKYFSKKNKPSS